MRWAVLIFAPCAACGTIEFFDASALPTGGADGGIGAQTNADGAITDPNTNGEGTPDSGVPPCRDRPAPPIPNSWPYKMTQVSWELHFGSGLPGRAACSTAACHGGQAGPNNTWTLPVSTPLIPPPAAVLDPSSLTETIQGTWVRALPTTQQIPAPTDPTPPLIWHHSLSPDGASQAPAFTPDQLAYMKKFIEMARDCGWVMTQMQERNLPPQNCVNGVCDCPITLDLSYCSQ